MGCAVLASALLAPGAAYAHAEATASGFVSGFTHPFTGYDHMLAMIGVGIWGAVLGRPLVMALPTVFPIMMAVGGVLGMAGLGRPPVELGVALSVLGLGLAIAAAYKAPVWAACAVVGVFALCHGYAHGLCRRRPTASVTAPDSSWPRAFSISSGLGLARCAK
jgi:urease accessory protein